MNDETIFEIVNVLYAEQSRRFYLLKETKNEEDDGTTDWKEFHDYRVETAQLEYNKALRIYTDFKETYRSDINRILGL